MRIDIIRTSASRPNCLKKSTESLMQKLKWEGSIRMILHEDFIRKSLSEECWKYAQEAGIFPVVRKDDPPLTQGCSLHWCISKTTTPYVLNWEDDWEAIRTIDLDTCVKIMEENPDVNQIAFHKRKIMTNRHGWPKKEVVRSGITLTTNPHWAFTPALWRMSFVRTWWQRPPRGNNPVWFCNQIVKKSSEMRSAEWMIENVGCYFLGGFREPAFVNHLGFKKSVRLGEI